MNHQQPYCESKKSFLFVFIKKKTRPHAFVKQQEPFSDIGLYSTLWPEITSQAFYGVQYNYCTSINEHSSCCCSYVKL